MSDFEDGLSKPAVARMAEGSISTSDLPWYVLDGLFDSFVEEETTSGDDYIRNYNVGELNNKTGHDCGISFDQKSDASDDISYRINQNRVPCCQCS